MDTMILKTLCQSSGIILSVEGTAELRDQSLLTCNVCDKLQNDDDTMSHRVQRHRRDCP